MSMVTQWGEGLGVAPGLRDALRSLTVGAAGEGELWRLGDQEVAGALSVVGQARQLLEAAEVALVREGLGRGLPGESSWSAQDWVGMVEGERSPVPPVRHVAQVVRVARAGMRPGAATGMTAPAEDHDNGAAEAGGVSGVAAVREAFTVGDLPLGKADQLVRFHERVAPVADPVMLEENTATLLEGARDGEVVEVGPVGGASDGVDGLEGRRAVRVRGLSEKELAAAIRVTERLLKPEKDLDREDERAKAGRSLTKGVGPCGMARYSLVLEPEGAAVLDSALAALSGPVKAPDGELDPRPAARRRADALVEIVRRGVSAPGEAPRCEKAQVVVTIGLETLLHGVHGAGVTSTGEVLPPGVVRRMACDGGIIPAVLGGDSEVLDLGRAVRWFTPGQKRAIWLRDKGCTYPGCTMPPQWCDAHHVDWWSRGGPSDISNGALLCQRHHTKVHSNDLTATITPTTVTWHL